MRPIPYGRQKITEADEQIVLEVLRGDFLTQGPYVEKFETEFAKQIGTPHAVAVTNGTAALHLSALALGVKPGDTVLVTPITFAASANCIRYCGGDVEFIDIDPDTYCIDLSALEKKLASAQKRYVGVVAVDFAGYPMNFEKLRQIADQYKLWVIEDACHALGAEFKNSQGEWVKTGNGRYADLAVFSFHPVKHVATGEGGMVATARPDLYEKLKTLRTHGITKEPSQFKISDSEKQTEIYGGWYMEMQSLGFNYRIPDILCALGFSQIQRLKENIQRRNQIAMTYANELKNLPIKHPVVHPEQHHAFHLYVILTERRKELYEYLRENKIYPQVHYLPVYRHPYYQELYPQLRKAVADKGDFASFAKAEHYYQRTLSLPMYHSLSDSELGFVIETIKNFFKKN